MRTPSQRHQSRNLHTQHAQKPQQSQYLAHSDESSDPNMPIALFERPSAETRESGVQAKQRAGRGQPVQTRGTVARWQVRTVRAPTVHSDRSSLIETAVEIT